MYGLPAFFLEMLSQSRLRLCWTVRLRHARKALEAVDGDHRKGKACFHRRLVPTGIDLSGRGALELREGKVPVLAIDGGAIGAEVVA